MSQTGHWYQGGDGSESLAARYERLMVPAIFGPWATDMMARASPRPGDRILDVACGTGIVAREARRIVGETASVTGIDLNPGMLAVARATDPDSSIDWREGSALDLPFSDAAFTLVLCQQGLQYFPDRAEALREMRRVLEPGGRVVLSLWRAIGHSPGFAALGQAWARYVRPDTNVLPPFVLGEGERLPAEVEVAGFHDIRSTTVSLLLRYASIERFVVSFIEASPMAEAWSQTDEPMRDSVLRDVHAALGSYIEPGEADGPLAFPIETQYITGWS